MSSPATAHCPRWHVSTRSWLCPIVWCVGFLVIFGAGAVCGMTGQAYWHHSFMLWIREHPEEVPDSVVERLTSSLALTEDQIPQVKTLVHRYHGRFETILVETRPRIDEQCAEYEQEMKQVLSPEQYAVWLPKFQEIRKLFLP